MKVRLQNVNNNERGLEAGDGEMPTVITRRSLQMRTFQSSVEEKCHGEHAPAQLFFLLAEGSKSIQQLAIPSRTVSFQLR